jgi:ClpP class serine protease
MTPEKPFEAALQSRIETLALQGSWDIDFDWGAAQLGNHLQEMDLLKSGVPIAELGIIQRKEAAHPRLVQADGSRARLIKPELLREKSEVPAGSFAILKLNGVMRASDGMCSRGIDSLIQDFYAAYDNDNIEGIMLEINSGGGESMAGSMLQNVIGDSPKAVVSWFHMMASAALRAALQSDEIIGAGEGAMAGSIGTYITLDKWFAQYYSKYYEEIYADKSSRKNRSFREYLKGNNEPMREEINKHNDIFLEEVQKYRQLRGDVERTLSGEMFSAKDAKRRGLSDGTGGMQYAIQRLQANVNRRKSIRK